MKLSCCKFNGLTLREETFNMNKFNVARAMKKLVNGMGLMFLGMSIPAVVFKSCDYMLTSYNGNVTSDFSGGIASTFKASSLLMISMAKCMAMFLAVMASFKLITTGDVKGFGKDMASIFIGYVLIELFKFIPIVIPNLMRAMGYL